MVKTDLDHFLPSSNISNYLYALYLFSLLIKDNTLSSIDFHVKHTTLHGLIYGYYSLVLHSLGIIHVLSILLIFQLVNILNSILFN